MVADALRRLEAAAEELRSEAGIYDQVASHVLAVRLLVQAGASDEAIAEVLRRAEALVLDHRRPRVA